MDNPAVWIGPLICVSLVLLAFLGGLCWIRIPVAAILVGATQLLLNYLFVFLGDAVVIFVFGVCANVAMKYDVGGVLPRARLYRGRGQKAPSSKRPRLNRGS